MQKINVRSIRSKATEEYRHELANEYIKKSWVRNFLNKYDLDENYLIENLGTFIRINEENEVCEHCVGYEKCPKLSKGFQTSYNPLNDEVIYASCERRNEYEKVSNNYIRRDFLDEWVTLDLLSDVKVNPLRKGIQIALMQLLNDTTDKGIYLYGLGESGKSFILASFCNELIRAKNKKVAFVDVSSFLNELKNLFGVSNADIEEKIKELQMVDVLVLDDIGGETYSAWSINDVLLKIIDYRNRNNLLTLYTSQYSLNELKKEYEKKSSKASRLIQKILAHSKELELKSLELL